MALGMLARISHHLTAEARDRPAITSLHLLAVLNVGSHTPPLVKRRAPRTDGPLTHFASPRGEIAEPFGHCGLFTVTNGPGSIETPATVAITSRFPSGALGGTFTTIW